MKDFKNWLLETVNIRVKDYDDLQEINNLDDISNSINNGVIRPLFDKISPEIQAKISKRVPAYQLITPDGDYYLNPKNSVLNFYSGDWPPDILQKAIHGIKYYLDNYKVKYGEFKTDQSKLFGGEVIRIPILGMSFNKNNLGELNIANEMSTIIFNDILNFPIEQKEFDARDIIIKIDNLSDFQINNNTQEPYMIQKGQASTYHGGVDEERIKRILNRLKEVANWAIANHYDTIYMT